MDTFFSSGGTTYYRVSAMVNKNTLHDYPVIKKDDKVYPYFVNSVHNDPDILGLTVFVTTPIGTIVSPKIQYTRKAEENLFEDIYIPEPSPETSPPETVEPAESEPKESDIVEPAETEGTEKPESSASDPIPLESPPPELAQTEPVPPKLSPEPVQAEPASPEPIPEPATPAPPEPIPEPVLPPNPVSPEPNPEPGQPVTALPEPVSSEPAVPQEVSGETPSEENPEEGLPAEEPASEESGGKSPEGTVAEEKPPETGTLTGKTQEIPVLKEEVVYVLNLDWQLPPFPVPETLDIGQYIMVFQVLGTQNALYEIELPFYFLGDAKFTLDDIHSYLPSVSPGAYLISPGEYVMLEALIESDDRLDPYLIWYSNKKRIGEGRLSEGAQYLFWEAPEKTGFQSITVEVFPFRPTTQIKGMVKELSLAVSKKNESRGAFSQTADQYTLWYRFEGNLANALSPVDNLKLAAYGNRPPQWIPWRGIYGLSVGADAVYQLPGSPFVLTEKEQGKGRFIFRVKLLGDGTVFKASFKGSGTSLDVLGLNLLYREGALIFAVEELIQTEDKEAEKYEERIDLQSFTDDFVVLFIDFEIRKNRFNFQLGIENTGILGKKKTIPLTNSLSGMGVFQFGENAPVSGINNRRNEKIIAPDSINATYVVFILDELGVLYTRENAMAEEEEPVAKPELETENSETV
ncbi:MAG: hypothetical protein LBT93_01600 [Treponema sp.]|nr:hypothetical protein [Treponema sp.]